MPENSKNAYLSPGSLLPNLCNAQSMLGIVLISLTLALFIALVRTGVSQFDFALFGRVSLLAFWSALLSALLLCRSGNWLAGQPLRRAALYSYLLILVAVLISACAASLWVSYLDGAGLALNFWVIADIAVVAAIPAGVVLRIFYLQQQIHQKQQSELQSRIEALQARIRPHFLFNSMNIIASLIAVDPEQAEQTVEDLSHLFRYALSDSNNRVSLEDEIEACQSYLALEKLRLEDRLEANWQLELDPAKVIVPPLILQPVVENAVFHGIQPAVEGGDLSVTIRQAGEWIEIDVNNSMGDRKRDTSGNHLALNNLRHRLDAFFDGQAELTAEPVGERFRTLIRFKPMGSQG